MVRPGVWQGSHVWGVGKYIITEGIEVMLEVEVCSPRNSSEHLGM